MALNQKIRLLGYYHLPNQKMNPESERILEAEELAPLLARSIQSLYDNPETDEELKTIIKEPTVFIFKLESGELCAYFTKEKIAKLTGVHYVRDSITQVSLKYKAWFYAGQDIELIVPKDSASTPKRTNSSTNKHVQRRKSSTAETDEVIKVKTRLRLENNFFIGQFVPTRNGWYKISDIRNTDFTKIEDKERGIKDLAISFRSVDVEFNRYAYYKFTWVLLETNPLKFGIDLRERVEPVYPQDIVRCLHDSIIHYPASAAKKITRTLDTLNKQLTQSGKEVFIYELLQNANDYPRKQKVDSSIISLPVDVEFHITDQFLTFQHTGEYFNAKNIAAICDINDGEKSDNVEAIGYKGIGFKTVFLDNDYVFLLTGNYSFRFDKSATDIINTPWQILPVWTPLRDVDAVVKRVFARHVNEDYRVKFALKPRDSKILTNRDRKDNYIDLFSTVFETERVILFIPNIRKVSVFIGDSNEPSIVREKSNSNWCVSQAYVDDIPDEIRERINDVLTNNDADTSDGYDKIPEKYLNFFKTSVKFACKRDGRKLLPVDDAILYCYLPTKRADWGFKFLMNTDMVPNGPRDDIEDIELNHEIAKIAGRQFFYWIKDLIASKEYEMDSIFALIPDFDKCKEKRNDRSFKDFIEEFQDEFERLITEEPFVPVIDADGNESLACIDCIIDDQTGITEKNVMSDADFISFMEINDSYLPVQELRESQSFMDFLYKYCPGEMDIDFDDVRTKCTTESFQSWLKDIDNNTRFIHHLIERDELNGFAAEAIFIDYKGELYKAEDLYYDFDEHCSIIGFLKKFVPNLCEQTRIAFGEVESWQSFANDNFIEFDASDIITNYIVDNEEAIDLLKEQDNSVQFYNFIALNGVDISDEKEKIPYITEDGDSTTDYDCLLYFFNEDAHFTSKEEWLGDNEIHVLSHVYLENDKEDTLKKLFEELGFATFLKEDFITNVVTEDSDFKDKVNAVIEDDFEKSIAFIKYVFACRETLKEKTLLFKNYVVGCLDIDDNETYLNNDDVRYFNLSSFQGNSTYEDNSKHSWLSSDMMYCLIPSYFDEFDQSDSKNVEAFFRQHFGIKTFTDKSFFADVVLKNKKYIYSCLTDEEDMRAFIAYLKRDMSHIFDGSLSYNEIKDMPLLCSDGTIITTRDEAVKLVAHNAEAIVLQSKDWCPQVFCVMAEEYSNGFSSEFLQLFKIGNFDFNEILSKILGSKSLKRDLENPDDNIDFWQWIFANSKLIQDYEPLKELPLLDLNDDTIICSSLYISDIYQNDGIEKLVKKYDEEASFVSDKYMVEASESKKNEWSKLFKKLGLKFDNKDILFNAVLPNLSSFEEDSVVAMMTKHIKDLKSVWQERKSEIVQLRVRTKAGLYKTLDEVIIINIGEETVAEPFKFIELSDEISNDILSANKELLLLIAQECTSCKLITSKQNWAEEKISEYIDVIQPDVTKRDEHHVEFVRELAKLCQDYDFSDELLNEIVYQTKSEDDSYKQANQITLSSIYSPVCDFEANGVTDLDYLSDEYIFEGNRDIIKSFFKARGLHHQVTIDDLQFLSDRAFACYFWTYCFQRRISEYENWIDGGKFNDIVCIPTETSVKKAKDLYHPRLVVYVAKSPEWKEKVPCKSVVDKIENRDARDLFTKLPFKQTLSLDDCLYYLLNAQDRREDETSRRKEIVNWILAADEINKEAIDNYRSNPKALWRNGKGQKKHITELYAIHPEARQQRAIFSGDENVLSTAMFPYATEEFERLCNILQIKCLKADDFTSTPINKVDETAGMMKELKPRLLILAAIENESKYKETYERYNEILSRYHFLVCDKIDLSYDTIHNDVERIYSDESHIYYVNSWLHNRTFTKFCSKIRSLLGISVYDNVCEDVLDGNMPIEQSIEKYCSALMYDASFIHYMENLSLSISQIEEDEHIDEDEDSYYTDPLSPQTGIEEEVDVDIDEIADDKIEPGNELIETPPQKGSEPSRRETISAPRAPHNDDDRDNGRANRGQYHTDTSQKPRQEKPRVKEPDDYSYVPNPDIDGVMGGVDNDRDYQPVGEHPQSRKAISRRHPKQYTKDELERLRSNGTPLELESLPATDEEINILEQCNITVEQIADTNYLAQLRLYSNLKERGDEPEEPLEDFIRNAGDVASHKLKSGKWIHTCSAARGVMYISPTIWNMLLDNKCTVCVYLDGKGKNFHYINTPEEFLQLVEKDDVVIKITGKEKVDVVKELYSGILQGVKGTAYTLIRVASRTNMDAVFAHYVGAMAESDDGNEDINEY